ncbi:hypothetical protein [Croceicoccus bisphenolivorans]|uniref:hypothetical protein n=1 Tax=Croceicoccus bisphenolivorans TaxID=1783232 RepID=UPI000829A73F|nr:hypothetical protein [Croceicoccus bisphenolivorans]
MSQPDPAFARWAAIQSIRVAGIALFIYAVLAANGRAPWFEGVPTDWTWALALIGASDAFLVPVLLARMWSSDKS